MDGDKLNITWSDFEKVELRAGTIIKAEDFPEAKILSQASLALGFSSFA